jgi:peptidyl-prolyl cis-trans isomerase B (cyclophilin B)
MKNIFYSLVVVVLLSSCGGNQDKLVVIETSYGNMTVLLYDETPKHKANFIKLAESGEYDSTIFHRVINGFMIQGGDIFRRSGKQEPDESRLPAEIVKGFYHGKGALSAARQGDQMNPEKKSSSCQFYIVHGTVWDEAILTTDQIRLNQLLGQMFDMPEYQELFQEFQALIDEGRGDEINALALSKKEFVEQETGINLTRNINEDQLKLYTTLGGAPHLDGEYTIFGRVVEGIDVIDKIAGVRTGPGDEPVQPVYSKMKVKKMSKKDITEKYGYNYPEAK